MNTRMFAFAVALGFPALASASLTTFTLQVDPMKPVYTQGDTVHAEPAADGDAMEYRYTLWRLDPAPAEVLSTAWTPGAAFDLATGSVITPSGKYRLLAVARESAVPSVRLQAKRDFRIATASEITAALAARHAQAAQQLRDALVRVIKRQGLPADVTPEYVAFGTADAVIADVLKAADEIAPGGGPAFVEGDADPLTGAIGVAVVSAPAQIDDWYGTEVELRLPAYLGMPAATLSVTYETVLSPEQEQAQRDLVVARYHEAIRKTTEVLQRVIRRQGYGIDLATEFGWFWSSDGLICCLLNKSNQSAPRGGNAYVDNAGGIAGTGAIGVTLLTSPTGINDNWWGTAVRIDLPAFLGLTPQSTTISYDTVLPEPEMQAQRDKVVARYNTAIREARKVFAEARDLLAVAAVPEEQFGAMADVYAFIAARLSPNARAPRSGMAYRECFPGTVNTGAICINVTIPPDSATDWQGAQMQVHLPAFLGLTAETTTINFDTD